MQNYKELPHIAERQEFAIVQVQVPRLGWPPESFSSQNT